ncbi:MAG TPA: hypothetical protein VG013_08245 [Gemmataceae bacterium]|jgi:hypothetical protein|nr:hypothetical protein [Gemmataceae bacterium]
MAEPNSLDREEYIEQAYFFRVLRERIAANMATQEILDRIHQEILSTTRLPYAIQFLATELKHSGLLSSGFARLPHYFTAFQAFVVRQTEDDNRRVSIETAMLVLEREAEYRAGKPTPSGLFVYQFETLSRNRLGYDEGLQNMAADPFYDMAWREYLEMVRRQVGAVDFADLVYLRSDLYVKEQRRRDAGYEPPLAPLFGEKEGKIAGANRGRDPLYLFAALQRQLGYPEVPRPRAPDDLAAKLLTLQAKFREMEMRLKLVESEVRGKLDLSQFMNKPDLLSRQDDE